MYQQIYEIVNNTEISDDVYSCSQIVALVGVSQSKILRMITNAPWYVTNQTLHGELYFTFALLPASGCQ
jgi:hypothetical protein